MIWVDYSIIGVIAISLLTGVLRGFVKEVMSLATWVAAAWIGFTFSRQLAVVLEAQIPVASIRVGAAFALLVVTTLIAGALLSLFLSAFVLKSGLSGTDRIFGMFFGVARGGLLVAVLILLAGMTPLPESAWWKESQLIPPFQQLALWLRNYIPSSLAHRITY